MIYFFCQRKLNSLDSAIPVLLEMHRATGKPVHFIFFDRPTVDLVKKNTVLYDAICSMGDLSYLGSGGTAGLTKFLLRARAVFSLTWLLVRTMIQGAVFIHSRALNEWPLRFLYFFNRNRTYMFGSDSYGMTEVMHKLTFIAQVPKSRKRRLSASAVVGYTEDWPWLAYAREHGLKSFLIGPPRSQQSFIQYIASKSDAYVDAELERHGIRPGTEIIAYMLTYLDRIDYLSGISSTQDLLRKTMDVLAEVSNGLPILMKPHPTTDIRIVEAEIAKRPNARFVIVHLHPTVLAARAKVVIANHYSATLADSFLMNTPTIEYTDYSAKALAITGNRSMRPEFVTHFINGDQAAFRSVAAACIAAPRQQKTRGQSAAIRPLLDDVCDRLGVARAA